MKQLPLSSPHAMFLAAAALGFALTFGGLGLFGALDAGASAQGGSAKGDAESFRARESASEPGAADMEAYRIATALVERRDAALLAGDAQALAALTVEGSPARQSDEALLAEAGGKIERLETVVMDVRPVSEYVWDVTTVQYDYALATGEEQAGPLPERCARWTLEPDLWRLSKTSECAS